jgi:cysteine synthase
MSRWLVKYDGLFLGSSSACNLVAAVQVAKRLGRNSKKTIVTILWVIDCHTRAKYRPPAGATLARDTIPK